MNLKKELNNLTNNDIYAMILFALYKSNEIPEYSSLSELSYILDKDSLLKLCEFYGGQTIKIPTIKEIEDYINALLVYQQVDIEHKNLQTVLCNLKRKNGSTLKIEENYKQISELLKEYNFNSGR